MTEPAGRLPVIIVLGSTQTLAWASSYYLPAVLADPISRDLGISSTWFFAAFSASLLVSAVIGPRVGRTIDAIGGSQVLAVSNLVFAAGLCVMALAHNEAVLWLAWLLLGIGMGLGLYDSAFATLGHLYGTNARPSITGITLLAGFASTIGWPLSAWSANTFGWRETCLGWAAVHIFVGLPLNLFFLPKPSDRQTAVTDFGSPVLIEMDRTMVLLAFAMASAWMVTAAMASHLPRLLEAAGATSVQAIAAGALVGPAQVVARIAEASLLRNKHPLVSAKLAAMAHPLGAAALGLIGTSGVSVFALLHGGGNGILTIARGTVPLAIYGPENYGYRLGLLGAPARIAQAIAPLLFGFLIERLGAGALTVSSALSLAALAAFCAVRDEK